MQELVKLSEKFEEHVLDATKKFEKLITEKKEIEGLPATALGLGAQTAVSKVLCTEIHQFVVTYVTYSTLAFLSHSTIVYNTTGA